MIVDTLDLEGSVSRDNWFRDAIKMAKSIYRWPNFSDTDWFIFLVLQ
jgi:hypothetical protein